VSKASKGVVLTMNKKELEFHLQYNKGRKNGQDVFIAMGEYISAYEKFGQILTDAIGSEISFECTLEDVREGSIIGKFTILFDKLTCPDELISELTEEIGTVEQLTEITSKNENRMHQAMINTKEHSNKLPPSISQIDTAYAMQELSNANKRLKQGESMTISDVDSPSNVISFDTKFRFTGDISKMFANHVESYDGEDLLEVIKPCNKGHLTWQVKSVLTGFEYNAPIEHSQWLDKYQCGEAGFDPQDYLKVNSTYDVYLNKGQKKIKNARIIRVEEVVKNSGHQNELF